MQSKNFQKKSHSAEKNLSEKHQDSQRGDPKYVFEVLSVGFVFCFGRGSEVSSVLNLRSSSCSTKEQKRGPYAYEKN